MLDAALARRQVGELVVLDLQPRNSHVPEQHLGKSVHGAGRDAKAAKRMKYTLRHELVERRLHISTEYVQSLCVLPLAGFLKQGRKPHPDLRRHGTLLISENQALL